MKICSFYKVYKKINKALPNIYKEGTMCKVFFGLLFIGI